MVSRHLRSDSIDPLSLAIAPPPERPRNRELRGYAKRRKPMRLADDAVQVLVLGQSMSGKSTTIKSELTVVLWPAVTGNPDALRDFQMAYAQKSWAEERASWRAVILLNLVRSVNNLIDILTETLDSADLFNLGLLGTSSAAYALNETHRTIMKRLGVLRQIERDLRMLLGSGASEIEPEGGDEGPQFNPKVQEFCVRSSSGWKDILGRIRSSGTGKDQDLQGKAFQVVRSSQDDILRIWKDPATKSVLKNRQVTIEDTPGFFLGDAERILSPGYEPSDQDIVRARLRTTGVQEYTFTLDRSTTTVPYNGDSQSKTPFTANHTPQDWIIYDVAESCLDPLLQRNHCPHLPTPLSSFNETLAEAPRVNCMDDTFALWKTICSNKLLAKVQIILFMNKTDILRKKLESGIKVRHYIQEFHDKGNDYETVATWFKKLFKRLYAASTPPGREFVAHFTSVVDTESTAQTLAAVQGAILRSDFVNTGLL
ncbi:G-alpha-domain-containing protein [Coprinellus micaceus]|uniref:G-alpha-domain-containing protein n=1 Tax=Coprinellus micaceus TaxID=71717 RepID=A0A4Y7TU16_COPMI|nr:G-alpha-domain-containing protein [Coprinellus micaceus]